MLEFNNRKVADLIKIHDSLKGIRAVKDPLFTKIRENFDPFAQDFIDKTVNNSGTETLLPESSVPRRTARDFIGFLYAYINPSSGDWIKATMYDPSYNEDEQIQKELEEITQTSISLLAKSNYYQEVIPFLSDWALYGKGVFLPLVGNGGYSVEFKHIPLSQCYVDDTGYCLSREYQLTATSLLQEVKSRSGSSKTDIPDYLITEVEKEASGQISSTDQKNVVYLVRPDCYCMYAKEFKFTGYLIDLDRNQILAVDFFDKFPYVISDFNRSSSFPYGSGVGEDALPDAIKINDLTQDEFNGIEMAILPPAFVDSSSRIDVNQIVAGQVVPFENVMGNNQPVTFMSTNCDIQSAELLMARLTKQLEDSFFISVFQSLKERSNMSATEVVERANEKIQVAMMFKTRLESEFLSKIMNHIFYFIKEKKIIVKNLEVSDVFFGEDVRYTYNSLIDSQIKQLEMEKLQSAMRVISESLVAFANIPTMQQYVSPDRIIKTILDGFNIPYSNRVSSFEKGEIRKKEELQAQQQQEAMMQQEMAKNINPNELMGQTQ